MGKSFDDLFREFFGGDDDDFQSRNKKRDDLIKVLTNPFNFENEKEIDNFLGEPDIIENYEDDGMYIKKIIWHTENGDVIKMLVSDVPFEEKETKLSLEEQLEEALAKEDYETAAKIRDEIKSKK